MRRGDPSPRDLPGAAATPSTPGPSDALPPSMSDTLPAPRGGSRVDHVAPIDVMASPEDRRLKDMIRASLFGDLSAPVRIGRFTVIEQIGSGGMGVVYAARDQELDRKVAIKLLRSDQRADASAEGPGDGADGDELARARLLREARAMARLSHPNVVTIHEVGSFEGQIFLAMEYLAGEDLAARLARQKRLSWPETRAIALEVCDALAAMHAHGIVHRDIKPHNIFLTRSPGSAAAAARQRVKVLDFGIAKLTGANTSSVLSTTSAGALVGTAAYIAPEQARAQDVDGRTDIYAVGLMLFEALTGQVPFSAPTFMAVVSQHLSETPPRLLDVAPDLELPPDVERVIMRCLAKQPEDRFEHVGALMDALRAIPDEVAAPRRAPGGWLVAMLVVLVLGALGTAWAVTRPVDAGHGEADLERPPPQPAQAGTIRAQESIAAAPSPGPMPASEVASEVVSEVAGEVVTDAAATATGASDVSLVVHEPAPPDEEGARSRRPASAPRTLPRVLDDRTIQRTLARRARMVQRCGRQNGGLPGTQFTVRFTVRPSGAVEQVTVDDPLLSPPLRRCLESVVMRARFPDAHEPTRGEHVFRF